MNYNFTHTAGDTLKRTLNFTDKNGVAIDLTDSTIVFSIKRKISDELYVLQKTAILANASGGIATIECSATEMEIDTGVYYYDIEWTDSIGFVRTFLKGSLTIDYHITQ